MGVACVQDPGRRAGRSRSMIPEIRMLSYRYAADPSPVSGLVNRFADDLIVEAGRYNVNIFISPHVACAQLL